MANTATQINKIPVVFQHFQNTTGTNYSLTQVLCSFDTTGTNLEAYAPGVNGWPAILGWEHVGGIDHNITISSADITTLASPTELITFQFNAGGGISKSVNNDPLIIGKQGKSFAIQVSAQPIKILLYVAEFTRINL